MLVLFISLVCFSVNECHAGLVFFVDSTLAFHLQCLQFVSVTIKEEHVNIKRRVFCERCVLANTVWPTD